MSRFSRDKGARFEREIVNTAQAYGIGAERVPLSGAMGSYKGDVTLPIGGYDRLMECKKRANGFTQIYGWLGDNYALAISQDRADTLVVLRLRDFLELARK